MAKNNGPKMVDVNLYIQAGIDPKTGLPRKFAEACDIKPSIKRFLRLVDEQQYCNRYKWYNIPFSLSSEEIERLLYYKGQLCAFFEKVSGKFYLMPYALDGTIDFYGRYNSVHPIPFASGEESADKESYSRLKDLLSQIKLECRYEPLLLEEVDLNVFENSCVLLHDYTKQVAQTIVPRWEVNDTLLDVMADIVPFLRTELMAGTGIQGIRVGTAEESDDVMQAAKQLVDQARKGQIWLPLTGSVEFQQLTNATISKTEDYLVAMQALDNIRMQGYGLPNGGIFEKKAHILESEQAMNQQAIDPVYQDGLAARQHFCNIFNSIYGTALWVMPAECVLDTDINADGLAVDMKNNDNVIGPENEPTGGAE